MKVKVIYSISIKHQKNDYDALRKKILKTVYNTLMIYSFTNSEIIIYTDFDGAAIFSILPYNLKIVNSNSIEEFNKFVNNGIDKYSVKLCEDDIIKNRKIFFGDYFLYEINKFKLSTTAIDRNISFEEIDEFLKTILGTAYYRLLNRIDKIIQR